MPASITISITERDILKAILEFLENHNFHISQLSLERETGVINGDYSEDLLFLRQLILDGQWDNAIDFILPLKEIPDFDIRSFRYFINKYKYYELLCIKQEPGPMQDNDFAVEEIVECLKELEELCSSAEDFRRLCALLTLKKLSDHEDLKIWNPSSARVECFYKVLPLVSDLLQGGAMKKSSADMDTSINDRLIQLFAKGMLYEAAVDYCQNQALDGKNATGPQSKFTDILLPKQKLSPSDLSLISWLEVLGNEQFTVPFQQKLLDFKLEYLKKPKLEARWAEQILATPIKPGGQFPHSLVPNTKLKCAQKMSQSMILPSTGMSSSLFTEVRPTETNRLHSMSQSTAAALCGFSINVKTLDDESTLRQSQIITNMLENVSEPKSSSLIHNNSQFQSQSSGIASAQSMHTSYSSIPSSADNGSNGQMTGSSYCRRELDAICRRNQSIPPSSLRGGSLPPVPELPTPGSVAPPSIAEQVEAIHLASEINPMINSRLFQEFTNKNLNAPLPISDNNPKMVPNSLPQAQPQHHASVAFRRYMPPQTFNQCGSRPASMDAFEVGALQPQHGVMNMAAPNVPMRPRSFAGGMEPLFPNTWNAAPMGNASTEMFYTTAGSHANRPENLNIPSSSTNSQASDTDTTCRNNGRKDDECHPVQFVPLCRYEDSQAIRAVAFHPSGKFFVIGTNSRQMHICKYPDFRRTSALPSNFQARSPEILLSRPKQHRGSVYCCGFNQSGELLATGSNDKTLRLMAFNADECRIGAEMELNIHDGTVRELIFMEDTSTYSSIIVSGGAGNCHICLTDCANGRLFKSFTGHTGPILGLYSWGPGTSFASCSQDRTIRFWDLRASSAVNVISPSIKSSNSPVTSVCVDPSGKLLVSGHEDASVMLYDIIGGRVVQIFRPHGDEVRTVRCSNAAYYLLSGSYDKRVVITDIRGDLTAPLIYLPVAEHADKVIQCRWHPQDFTFLSTSADRTAVLWSLPQAN